MNTLQESKENVVKGQETELTANSAHPLHDYNVSPPASDPDECLLEMFDYVRGYIFDYDLRAIEPLNGMMNEYLMNAASGFQVEHVMEEIHGVTGAVNLIVKLKTMIDKINPALKAATGNETSIFYSYQNI